MMSFREPKRWGLRRSARARRRTRMRFARGVARIVERAPAWPSLGNHDVGHTDGMDGSLDLRL